MADKKYTDQTLLLFEKIKEAIETGNVEIYELSHIQTRGLEYKVSFVVHAKLTYDYIKSIPRECGRTNE